MAAHDDLKASMEAYLVDSEKFERGNSAAGTRARKALADLAKAAKARRGEITDTKAERTAAKAGK